MPTAHTDPAALSQNQTAQSACPAGALGGSLAALASLASLLCGQRVIYGQEVEAVAAGGQGPIVE